MSVSCVPVVVKGFARAKCPDRKGSGDCFGVLPRGTHQWLWLVRSASARLGFTIRIVLGSALMLHRTVVFTVALFCAVVVLAKGPVYGADAYPLINSDRAAL